MKNVGYVLTSGGIMGKIIYDNFIKEEEEKKEEKNEEEND